MCRPTPNPNGNADLLMITHGMPVAASTPEDSSEMPLGSAKIQTEMLVRRHRKNSN
jgi:hypothetical protein